MSIVAEKYSFVVGVDTHARTHQFALIDAATGAVMAEAEFATSAAGLRRAFDWVASHTGGALDAAVVSVEGTGSYGAQLTGLLLAAGLRVVDAPTPRRARGADKNDRLDAVAAARNILALSADRLADARAGELSATLSVLLAARRRMNDESTAQTNALIALTRGHDLGIDARRGLTQTQIGQIARWRTRREPTPAITVARAEAVRLARRITQLRDEITANTRDLETVVANHAPALLETVGVGPVNAATILAAWSHPGRLHSEAAFAHLAGASPLQIASGNRSEHRLNRGGDRQLNRALHSITLTRTRQDPATRDYIARRTAEGLTPRRCQRILKRYIARQIFRTLNTMTPPATT